MKDKRFFYGSSNPVANDTYMLIVPVTSIEARLDALCAEYEQAVCTGIKIESTVYAKAETLILSHCNLLFIATAGAPITTHADAGDSTPFQLETAMDHHLGDPFKYEVLRDAPMRVQQYSDTDYLLVAKMTATYKVPKSALQNGLFRSSEHLDEPEMAVFPAILVQGELAVSSYYWYGSITLDYRIEKNTIRLGEL